MVSLCDDPIQSNAGWRFRFLGFPVRVHPYFWITTLLLSGLGETGSVLLWVLACFVSILLHETGHVAMMKLFGIRAEVILYPLAASPARWTAAAAAPALPFSSPSPDRLPDSSSRA